MLITILGLPLSTKYHEIKVLITQKCGIPDFILDNLLTDTDGTKKVRVGLADDAEGAHVIKCLNGYKLSGNVLRVVPFGKSGIARQNNSAPNHRSTFETQGYQNDFNQMGRSQVDPWGSHSQWTPQQQTGHIQNQNNLSYQQNRQGVLRTVEIVETPPQNLPGRHQPNYDLQRDRNGHEQKMDSYEKSDYGKYMPQDKRILKEQLAMKYKELDKPQYDPHEKKMLKEQLAMKYKHLEKSQYSPQNMHARGLQPRQVSPSPRHSPGRKMTGRMRSPPRRSVSPHGRRLSPPGRRLSPSGRRPSPSAGRTSPMGRSRRMSPGRRVSPAGRNPMEPPVDRRMPSKCVPPPPKTPKMATDVADVAQPAILYAVPNWDYSYAQNNSIMEIVNASKAYIAQNNMNKNMQNYSTFVQPEQNVVPEIVEPDQNVLYLCKDDFDPINSSEAVDLKNFLVQSMIEASNISRGVTPDFTLKGLQSVFRYEVEARDAASKEWLINLDFQKFRSFNVLVYTKEELWYERAAIWLPGHSSRYDKLKPFDKLRLQNKLDGVDLGKWKLVKQVVTLKGVRLYVDMPPSSARALEKHKMKLSYELQKVDVYLKAVAVDKDAFDAGLKVKSIEPPVETATMSSLPQDTKIIKFALKGDKPISMPIARKIKSNIVSNIFKYLTNGGKSKIDVVKYGIAHPGYFGLLPENDDTRRWFLNYNSGFGMVNKLPVVIVGGNDQTRYVRMEIFLPPNVVMAATSALEKLRSSNHGVKKLNITKWKAIKINKHRSMNKSRLEVEIDIESVETLRKMGFKLDFVISANQCYSVDVRSVDSERNLINMLEKYKSEQSDSYEVSNMDIASSDDDVSNIYWEKQGQENCLCKALHIYLVSSIKHKREEDANTGVLYSFRRLMVLSVLVEDFQKLEQHMGRFCNMQHVIAKKPRLVAAKPSEPPKKYTPVEKDEGSAHVTVTPCYRFMKCPEGLKTKFVDESDAEKDTSLVSENAEKKSEDTTEIIKSADESQKINDGNKKEDELKVAKTIKIEEADNTNKVETAREIAIEANTNISEKMKTEEPSMPQKITSKIIPDVKKEVSKAEEGKKMEVNKNKLTKVNETTIEKSSPQVESVEKTLKDTNAKIVENKPTVKQEFVKNVAKIQTQGKTITKPVNSLQAQTKRVEVKKNLKNVSKADDFEEMADDEILALLSSGVVLDECGSDEE
ncbi:unnamed protein product [Leptidea sinapis]|uniref:DUF4780 domain-containing protein n=1 Tax=Leptidea sinapis TaxID=189913 RepID=A0A5E4Q704_9NEOP|nr:unnamed protein product [Leptidea sinapis]